MLRRLIDRPISVTMILLAVLVLGVVSIFRLPISLIPDVAIPQVTVSITAADMSARELDESVVKPLRQQLIQTAEMEEIVTEAKDGSATIRMTFSHGADINYAYIEVNEKIDRAMSSLPGIDRPRVMKASATDIPAFYLSMTSSEEDFMGLSQFAREVISKRIEQLPQVAMTDISGVVSPEIIVTPDEDALRRLGLDISKFEDLVKAADVSLGNLTIRDGEYHYNVRFRSFAGSAEDIANVYFRNGDKIFQIRDVASVVERPAPQTGGVISDGSPAVIMAVIKQSEAKMSDLKASLQALLDSFSQDYPQIGFSVSRDQTQLLEYSINNLLRNILMGVLFACIIIFLFMKDFRSPTLVALTIPSALLMSMLVFRIIGLSINIISLSGLLLGVGMMVDNSMILIDNLTARWNRGEDLRTAVLAGTNEMVGPMLSSVLTTCAVFIPLVFMSGITGALFYDQAMAITIVLLTSYIVTVIIIPVYYYQWYKRQTAFRPNRFLQHFDFPAGMRFYERAEAAALRHRWVAVAVLVCSVALIFVCIKWMPREKLPPMTYTDTVLNVDWNENVTYEENLSRVRCIEAWAGEAAAPERTAGDSHIRQITSMVGVQNFVLSHTRDMSISEASVYIDCDDVESLEAVRRELERRIRADWPEARISFEASGNIFDAVFAEKQAALTARLRPVSSPLLELDRLNGALADIRRAVPNVRIDDVPVKEDILYVADPERMALYEVSYDGIMKALKVAMNGNEIFTVLAGSSSVPVVLGTSASGIEDVMKMTVRGNEEIEVRLSDLLFQTYAQDLKTLVSGAESDYYPLDLDVPSGSVRQTMTAVRKAVSDNGDFEVSFTGSWFSNARMIRQMLLILLVAVLLLFLILAAQFESLVQPLIILSEIIVDIAVCLAIMWLCGVSVNLMSLIGLVVICGIVINDSILKIDTVNRLRRAGMGVDEAIREAGRRRVKAIIMTSLTTIFAVVPFLSRGNMGDDLQFPMSVVIIVGMTVGTIVSLLLVPALYSLIYRRR